MPRKRIDINVDTILLELVEESRSKLPYNISRSDMFNRSMAYYLGCLEDYVHKKGRFKYVEKIIQKPDSKKNGSKC